MESPLGVGGWGGCLISESSCAGVKPVGVRPPQAYLVSPEVGREGWVRGAMGSKQILR